MRPDLSLFRRVPVVWRWEHQVRPWLFRYSTCDLSLPLERSFRFVTLRFTQVRHLVSPCFSGTLENRFHVRHALVLFVECLSFRRERHRKLPVLLHVGPPSLPKGPSPPDHGPGLYPSRLYTRPMNHTCPVYPSPVTRPRFVRLVGDRQSIPVLSCHTGLVRCDST